MPTELSRAKGSIESAYPVVFEGTQFKDAETAYQAYKTDDERANDEVMADIIAEKFRQHPRLASAVAKRGGAEWLASCDHLTGARSDRGQSWEGKGLQSRYIRNLVEGYRRFARGQFRRGAQAALF